MGIPLLQQKIHALTGDSSAMERNRSYAGVQSATDSYDLGIALHRLGDSFAHSRFGNEGQMYGSSFWSFGHAGFTGDGDPDIIRNRPWLYSMYTDRLAKALKQRFGYEGKIDMFAFDYVWRFRGH